LFLSNDGKSSVNSLEQTTKKLMIIIALDGC